MTSEKLAYFKRDNIDKMDIKSALKKKRMCIAIAKYYIKIFQKQYLKRRTRNAFGVHLKR